MIKNDDGSVTIEDTDIAEDKDEEIVIPDETDEKLKSDLLTSIAKKKAWREKAIDPTSKKSYKELYESIKTQAPLDTKEEEKKETKKDEIVIPDDIRNDINSLKEESQKRIFQHANTLSPTQVDQVFAYAKGMSIEPKAALEQPFIKKVIEQLSSDDEASNASLSPSRRAPAQMGGKSFKDLTPDERKKSFSSFAKSR